MTTGNVLYLAMTIGMFGMFALMLAYQSWRQSALEVAMAGAPVERPAPQRLAQARYEETRDAHAA